MSSARNSLATQDLQRIIDTTQAHIQTHPGCFEDTATPPATPNMQQVPRVQTPTSVPTPHTDDNRRITRSMLTHTPILRVSRSNKAPINRPTNATKWECLRKWQPVWLHDAATPLSTSPRIRTRAQVATAAAQVAPPSMGTISQAQRFTVPPPSRLRQQQHQCGMVCLTCRITRLENEVHQAMSVMDADTGKLLNYRQLLRSTKYRQAWSLSSANEFGWLANDIKGRIKNPTNTIEFIFQHDVPTERKKDVTHGQFVCTIRLETAEPNRTRLLVEGDRINYPSEVTTPTVEMLVAKMLFNSVISMKGAHLMTMDITNFYLMTPLHHPEFIQMKLSNIPDEVIKEYKLREKATTNGTIYIKAKLGVYGLPQSGLLANELLEKRLNKHGYRQSKLIPGLWTHTIHIGCWWLWGEIHWRGTAQHL